MTFKSFFVWFVVILIIKFVISLKNWGGYCRKCGSSRTHKITRIPMRDRKAKRLSKLKLRVIGHLEQKCVLCESCEYERQTSLKYIEDGRSWRDFNHQ